MTSRKNPGQRKRVEIQEFYRTASREGVATYFEVQSDSAPTKPLLHKNSRFLYVLSGKGTIRIYDKNYTMEPGAVIALLPWEISEIVEVKEPLCYYLLIYPFEFLNFIVKNQFNIENEKFDMVTLLYRYGGVRVPLRRDPPRDRTGFHRNVRRPPVVVRPVPDGEAGGTGRPLPALGAGPGRTFRRTGPS